MANALPLTGVAQAGDTGLYHEVLNRKQAIECEVWLETPGPTEKPKMETPSQGHKYAA